MTHSHIAAFVCATSLALGIPAAHAQTDIGPGGYVYEYQSPSIMLVKPEGWEPPKAEPPKPKFLRPIMPTDLYEDGELTQTGALEDAIGRPADNALGPVLAAQRAEERKQMLAAETQAEQDASQMAGTTEQPNALIDRQTTAALPDGDQAEQDGVVVENGVEIIRGDSTDAAPSGPKRSMAELSGKQRDETMIDVEEQAEADGQDANPADPEFSGMKMRY